MLIRTTRSNRRLRRPCSVLRADLTGAPPAILVVPSPSRRRTTIPPLSSRPVSVKKKPRRSHSALWHTDTARSTVKLRLCGICRLLRRRCCESTPMHASLRRANGFANCNQSSRRWPIESRPSHAPFKVTRLETELYREGRCRTAI